MFCTSFHTRKGCQPAAESSTRPRPEKNRFPQKKMPNSKKKSEFSQIHPIAYLPQRDVFSELQFDEIFLTIDDFDRSVWKEFTDVARATPADTVFLLEDLSCERFVLVVAYGERITSQPRRRRVAHDQQIPVLPNVASNKEGFHSHLATVAPPTRTSPLGLGLSFTV